MLNEQVRVLAEKVMLPIGSAATQLPQIKMVGFSAMHGSHYDGRLMVIGRAVNSFWRVRFPEEFSSPDSAMNFAQNVVDDSNINTSCPMGWLNQAWAGEVKYKAKMSTFWRAINAVMQGLALTTDNDEDWASKLVWSNLYKVSPQSGGNPSNFVCDLQLPGCLELLQLELEYHKPSRVVFATGMVWAKPFLTALGFSFETDPQLAQVDGFGRGRLRNGHELAFVVASHPQGKPGGHQVWADEVLSKLVRP
ncbi:MAG: hypothetical protein Q7U84_05575 [Polynucleobacter sp.]|nr:hypothetical protein [Polynucleobacter sp.]